VSVPWHSGVRPKADAWSLARVKTDMGFRTISPGHVPIGGDLPELCKERHRCKEPNGCKDTVAPWSRENSEHARACSIADPVTALDNWRWSRNGSRKGRKVAGDVTGVSQVQLRPL